MPDKKPGPIGRAFTTALGPSSVAAEPDGKHVVVRLGKVGVAITTEDARELAAALKWLLSRIPTVN